MTYGVEFVKSGFHTQTMLKYYRPGVHLSSLKTRIKQRRLSNVINVSNNRLYLKVKIIRCLSKFELEPKPVLPGG